jgi:hypothetical protein
MTLPAEMPANALCKYMVARSLPAGGEDCPAPVMPAEALPVFCVGSPPALTIDAKLVVAAAYSPR